MGALRGEQTLEERLFRAGASGSGCALAPEEAAQLAALFRLYRVASGARALVAWLRRTKPRLAMAGPVRELTRALDG